MFKKHAIQMKLVTADQADDNAVIPTIDPEEIVRHTRAMFKDAAKGVAIVVVSYVVLDTLRQIAVNNTDPSNK